MKLGTAGINLDYDYSTCPECNLAGLRQNGLVFRCPFCGEDFDIEELLTIEIEDDADDQGSDAKRQAYLEKEAGLPITLRLNHIALGMDENTVCEACKRGDHWDCNLATWCQCDDDCDGDKDCLDYSPIDDLP